MADLVVTVPKWFWRDWTAEGDAAGEPESGEERGFFLGGSRPDAGLGEWLYIVAHGLLRGWAPVVRTDRGWAICRRGGAQACTIKAPITGFRGWRRRWWDCTAERPFQDWRTRGAA